MLFVKFLKKMQRLDKLFLKSYYLWTIIIAPVDSNTGADVNVSICVKQDNICCYEKP